MWPIQYDKLEERWELGEFSRTAVDPKNEFLWEVEAMHAIAVRNARLRLKAARPRDPSTSRERSNHTEYDVYEPSDVWPGGLVSYGTSRG